MNVYEFVVFFVPYDKKSHEKAAVLSGPTVVLARTEDHARTLAARAVPEAYLERLDEVTVKVRPF